ncbi:uncharacterized protein LOC104414911 isoform X3 [Eucalyptus grandis]|uniref:uncharacterized protein LOC104414911 isoform X3 n=1 Tax=Eucalyptus grandis TaxID=71139 RepID=UPI00192F02A7|nr:uncharacterized protein LOC104414911 isoform X3 [Eucalyptus grandis]
MKVENSAEGPSSIHLNIPQLQKKNEIILSPISAVTRDGSTGNSVSPPLQAVPAPEKKLTLFALRLAVLEKAATGLGALGFIWATVVLLGGFAISLDKNNFWFITIILISEGTRIFSRSHELEWQHLSTSSIGDAGISSFRKLRSSSRALAESVKDMLSPVSSGTRKPSQHSREVFETTDATNVREQKLQRKPTRKWTPSEVPILPYGGWVFLSRNISKIFYLLQLLSAIACVVLSLMKLIMHNYGKVKEGESKNQKTSLIIFYALALAEALVFLTEKVYWQWTVVICKLLEGVNEECNLEASGMISTRRFFYDSYSRCINGSIFDGLGMDMVTFAMDLICSNSPDEQLIGARILHRFSFTKPFSDDTLQKIGTTPPVIERLVEILNWEDPQEEEIRLSAANIISKLAGKKQNSLRVVGITGAMESISSLLQTNRSPRSKADKIGEKKTFDHEAYGYWTFNSLGLLILKELARDHDNCGKIGNTRGLLSKIIDFTHADEAILRDSTVATLQVLTVERSLKVIKMLASTTGTTGRKLRRDISERVFTISNIRDILRYGEKQPKLQKRGIEILTSLAQDDDATERMGGTGGVLKELLKIFFQEGVPKDQKDVRIVAGEALAKLAFGSKSNCHRILKLNVVERLIEALEIPLLHVNAGRILRNMCAYSGPESFNQLKGVTAAAPTVLKAILSGEGKLQEVMVGLAAHAFKFMTAEESTAVFERAGFEETKLACALVEILRSYRYPDIKVPRMRRFAIELAIWMMRDNMKNVQIFRDLGMEEELEGVLDTTSELESFNIFSGSIGLRRHSTTIHSLVETALMLLKDRFDQPIGH